MGQEISQSRFRKQDFVNFEARLQQETELLAEHFDRQRFSAERCVAGFELEAWLVDEECRPLPENERLLAALDSELVVPELARFNVELNGEPRHLSGKALSKMQRELAHTWALCQEAAAPLGGELLMVGILPTVREQELVLANMSAMTRYRALNEQVLRMRQGHPLELDIQGREHLKAYHQDVMLESPATSFQLHLQMDPRGAVRAFNAAIVLSAPMVAVSANSPYLFGYDLWDETRIALFEQAVSVCTDDSCSEARVTFGHGYVRNSLLECFIENRERYPVLLPETLDEDPALFSHLRLHNGTIWRWNRPLVGFDGDGRPHLRIEHRVIPSGPSLIDAMANAALFFGLACELSRAPEAPEARLGFMQAKENFYAAARHGLRARVRWLNGNEVDLQSLLREELIPLARRGLQAQAIDPGDIELYMGVIEARLRNGRNGSAWQRAYVAKHGRDMRALAAAYRERQRSGNPVHEWEI